jgi:hypothetical protein
LSSNLVEAFPAGSADDFADIQIVLGLQRGGLINETLLARLIECNLKRGDSGSKLLANVVSNIHEGQLLSSAFDRMGPLLDDNKVAYAYEKEWATALDRLFRASSVDADKRERHVQKFGKILEQFNKRQSSAIPRN